MKQANIMCFTGTFLRPQQQLMNNKLPMQEECMVFRLDRMQLNSEDLNQGWNNDRTSQITATCEN